ncbi:FAST kinase domain-containing protein 1, mitochondrial [Bombina bombina]|uniref:FAST kinase domain-containing protein 1, mitochondrial n=1 Tax=Bombina bombina TaxID=8345 RepID=UPI00235A83DD|nr:FAST kinase domain-containing protein 1, mitochondrial [Bombina bombina]XP_053554380.1 FAST kinase domain-containing protein 1, mitochondrial [Bombina bombina]XP_053554381.1 FAST kinase domain-containing protein 1, mitochondrial [Bombina bombina]
MFRWRGAYFLASRLYSTRPATTDSLLDQLKICISEDQVFQLVGKNKAKLSATHVTSAIDLLWEFQKEKPKLLRTINYIKGHQEFIALRILAENKISLIDDEALVELLYNVMRLNVEAHDSLMQELVVEGWRRLHGFNSTALSKFAVCLVELHMQTSPLTGQVASIVDQILDDLHDARILSSLMVSICSVISPRLRDRLVEKAECMMDDVPQYNHARRIVQFLRNIKYTYRPLLEKCNKIFLQSINHMDLENLCIIIGLYQSLQFNNCEFRLMAKTRLTQSVDDCDDVASFTKVFAALGPMAMQETRERLEDRILTFADEMNPHQVLAVLGTMEEMECRNNHLHQKISSLLQKYLDFYRPIDLAKIAQSLVMLRCQTPELFSHLQKLVISHLKKSIIPSDVAMLTRIFSVLPSPRVDESIISKIDAVLPQCNLSDLSAIALAIVKWVRTDQISHYNTSGAYGKLLQKLNGFGLERVKQIDNIDLLLDELKYMTGDWLEEVLLKETVATCQRLIDQVTCKNIPEFALFITRTNYLSPQILDRIASVASENITKFHYTAIYAILLPFVVLNYEPPQEGEFFEMCIEHFLPHLNTFDPHLLVLLGYSLAVAEYFPEDLIKAVFNVEFLGKLDAQLETLPTALNMRIRLRLMELNRAVCIECPEYQIPWFHEKYCQQLHHKVNGTMSSVQRQIHQMLGEILGGINYAKVSVMTPYYHDIDFECLLDKNKKPIPYMDENILSADLSKLHTGLDGQLLETKSLPPGAQRVAIEFLDSKAFCKNSSHLKGGHVMKKRHLEILGYHVVQISSFEWNSMELSTKDAWKDYLRKSIFADDL